MLHENNLTNPSLPLDADVRKSVVADKKTRVALARRSHMYFFAIYLPHYLTCPSAPFHTRLFEITEKEALPLSVTIAFRGSAKSTIMALSYPLWAIMGRQQKKFVVLVAQTQRQARQMLANIRIELETNALLRGDLGPFTEDEEWGAYSLVLPVYGARITAVSMDQTIRGMRHRQYRPDLIICDDVENQQSVATREGRNKIFEWVTGEIIPAGDRTTKIVFIGNLLHEDSLLVRLRDQIALGELTGAYDAIPLLGEGDAIAWPGKYPAISDVEEQRRQVANSVAWNREYLLRIVPDCDQVVHNEWIRYYDTLPPFNADNEFRFTVTGIDLAISQKMTADYTAMVSAHVFGYGDKLRIYITPNPVNERLTHNETLERAKALSTALGNGKKTKLVVEDVGYQRSVVQELQRFQFPAEGAKVHGGDKRARLSLVSHLIENGTVLFPRRGCERLIGQLVHFGVEKYDDLADAFSMLLSYIVNEPHAKGQVGTMWLDSEGEWHECFV